MGHPEGRRPTRREAVPAPPVRVVRLAARGGTPGVGGRPAGRANVATARVPVAAGVPAAVPHRAAWRAAAARGVRKAAPTIVVAVVRRAAAPRGVAGRGVLDPIAVRSGRGRRPARGAATVTARRVPAGPSRRGTVPRVASPASAEHSTVGRVRRIEWVVPGRANDPPAAGRAVRRSAVAKVSRRGVTAATAPTATAPSVDPAGMPPSRRAPAAATGRGATTTARGRPDPVAVTPLGGRGPRAGARSRAPARRVRVKVGRAGRRVGATRASGATSGDRAIPGPTSDAGSATVRAESPGSGPLVPAAPAHAPAATAHVPAAPVRAAAASAGQAPKAVSDPRARVDSARVAARTAPSAVPAAVDTSAVPAAVDTSAVPERAASSAVRATVGRRGLRETARAVGPAASRVAGSVVPATAPALRRLAAVARRPGAASAVPATASADAATRSVAPVPAATPRIGAPVAIAVRGPGDSAHVLAASGPAGSSARRVGTSAVRVRAAPAPVLGATTTGASDAERVVASAPPGGRHRPGRVVATGTGRLAAVSSASPSPRRGPTGRSTRSFPTTSSSASWTARSGGGCAR